MTITVREDEDASGGYAFLDLGKKFDRSEPRLSIRRLNAEPRHLGLEGWQFEPAWLEPEASINNGGATVLRLGPQIIDQIEELVRIEISVEGEGTYRPGDLARRHAVTPEHSRHQPRGHHLAQKGCRSRRDRHSGSRACKAIRAGSGNHVRDCRSGFHASCGRTATSTACSSTNTLAAGLVLRSIIVGCALGAISFEPGLSNLTP